VDTLNGALRCGCLWLPVCISWLRCLGSVKLARRDVLLTTVNDCVGFGLGMECLGAVCPSRYLPFAKGGHLV